MKVRVFVPRECGPADGFTFDGTDYNFPMLPSVGHVLHFTNERAGEFTVVKVGFMQEGPSFVAAVWVEGAKTKATSHSDPNGERGDVDRYRDLNSDVPPGSMEGY